MTFASEADWRSWQLRAEANRHRGCTACGLCKHRTQTVYGRGGLSPRLLLIGDAPSLADDENGGVFSDMAGKLLDGLLAKVGLSKKQYHLTNMVLCCPPRERAPRSEETIRCQHRLETQVRILTPNAIMLLGPVAARWAGAKVVSGNRGLVKKDQWPSLDWFSMSVLKSVGITYHPRFVLGKDGVEEKQKYLKRMAKDIKAVLAEIKNG